MSTLTKPRAKKAVRVVRRAEPAARVAKLGVALPVRSLAPRLVPPPARLAAEIADLLPPPASSFDAAAVARVVASRRDR